MRNRLRGRLGSPVGVYVLLERMELYRNESAIRLMIECFGELLVDPGVLCGMQAMTGINVCLFFFAIDSAHPSSAGVMA